MCCYLRKTLFASLFTFHFSFALLIKMSPPSSATKKKRRRRRFAIVDCEDEVEFSYVAIAYSRLLSFSSKSSSNSSSNQEEEEEEIWEHHRVPEGELPDMSEIETYDGIVITGSRHSAVDGVKSMRWMKHLKQFLERVARLRNEKKQPKIFAVNFGAHVLCEALGGKVRRRNSINSNEEEELDVIGKFTCEFDTSACEKAFPKSVWSNTRAIIEEKEKRRMKMVSKQRDEICELPVGAVMLTKAVVDDDDDDDDNSSDEEKEKESPDPPEPESVFQPVPHEFSKFIPERQKPKVAGTNSEDANAHEKKKKKKEQIRAAKKKKPLSYSNEAVCCWAWSPSFSDDKDNTKSKARVLAWQHTLLRDEEKEKKKKEYDPESDPSIAFLSLARAFLRSKNDDDENDDDESSGVSYLKDSKTSLSKCLQAARETIEAKSLDQWKKKSIVRDENGNVTEHDENEVVVLDKMESVAEQAFLATAKAVKSELDYASEEFRLYSSLNEVAKNAFERCTKEVLDARVFVEKIADTEKKIHCSILPTIEALEKQIELFETTVQNAEKKCDEIDARIAKLA